MVMVIESGFRLYTQVEAGREFARFRREAGFKQPRSPLGPHFAELIGEAGMLAASFGVGEIARASTIKNLPETVNLAAGSFPVEGSQLFGSQRPSADCVNISEIEVGKFPVTVAQYGEFYEATDHGAKIAGQEDAEAQKALVKDSSKGNHPMVHTTDTDRRDYVKWLSEQTGETWGLLTAAEFEYVVRGVEGRLYPCGPEYKQDQAPYFNTNATAPVDSFPTGATPEKVAGFGIVWEATESWFGEYDSLITDNPQGPLEGKYIEVRGGSAWVFDQYHFRGALRGFNLPDIRYDKVGFRLAKRT